MHLTTRYVLLEDILYKKSYSKLYVDPYLRCLRPDETQRVMQKIHDSDCGNHSEGCSLAHKDMVGHQSRVLLTHDVQHHQGLCEEMLAMSEIRPSIKQTKYRPPHFVKSLALHAMMVRRG